jgi:hypothetical protein
MELLRQVLIRMGAALKKDNNKNENWWKFS